MAEMLERLKFCYVHTYSIWQLVFSEQMESIYSQKYDLEAEMDFIFKKKKKILPFHVSDFLPKLTSFKRNISHGGIEQSTASYQHKHIKTNTHTQKKKTFNQLCPTTEIPAAVTVNKCK